jgi:hypothetical protein
MGGVLGTRINIHPEKVILNAAPPLNISKDMLLYRQDRKGTVQKTMDELKAALVKCIGEEDNKQ